MAFSQQIHPHSSYYRGGDTRPLLHTQFPERCAKQEAGGGVVFRDEYHHH